MSMLLEEVPKVSSRRSGEKRTKGREKEKSRGGFQIYSKPEVGGSPSGDAKLKGVKCGDLGENP